MLLIWMPSLASSLICLFSGMLKSYFRQSRRESSSGEKMPPKFFSGCSMVLVKVPSASFTLATLYTCSTLWALTCSITLYSHTSGIPLRFMNRPPPPLGKCVVLVYFMYHYFVHFQFSLPGTWSCFLSS